MKLKKKKIFSSQNFQYSNVYFKNFLKKMGGNIEEKIRNFEHLF